MEPPVVCNWNYTHTYPMDSNGKTVGMFVIYEKNLTLGSIHRICSPCHNFMIYDIPVMNGRDPL